MGEYQYGDFDPNQDVNSSYDNNFGSYAYGYPYVDPEDQMQEDTQNASLEDGGSEMSPYMRRCQNFSHQKEHKKLFRELNMDWEDRMIHRKLGGWSLKGNRPKEFSQAAKKRQKKGTNNVPEGG